MQSKDNKTKVTVNIFDCNYVIKADENEEYIISLAEELNKKMRQISNKKATMPPTKVAVLVALNLLDELKKLQEEYDSLVNLIKDVK